MSYFNPYKYHEHWEKTKKQNYELHDSNEIPRNETYKHQSNIFLKAHTDDYLNLSLRDFDHNNNYNTKSFKINRNFNNEQIGNKKYMGFDGYNGFNSNRYQQQSGYDLRQNKFQQEQVLNLKEPQLKRIYKPNKHQLKNNVNTNAHNAFE